MILNCDRPVSLSNSAIMRGWFIPQDISDLTPPQVQGPVATTVSYEEIRVNWTASSSSHDHYNIYRDGLKVAEVDIEETSYLDTGLQPETTYTYTVSVVDGDGDVSDPSDPSQATTDVEPVDDSFDGTDEGFIESLDNSTIDSTLNQVESETECYWTGPWPELNYKRVATDNDDVSFHFKRDLVGTVTVCSVSQEPTIEPNDDYLDEVLVEFIIIDFITSSFFFFMSRALDIFEYGGYVNLYALGASFVFWVTAVVYAMCVITMVTVINEWSWEWAAAMFVVLGIECLIAAFGGIITSLFNLTLGTILGNLLANVAMNELIEAITGLWLKKLYFVLAAGMFFTCAWQCLNGGIT